ncbi:MAG: hypothetical protein EOO75_09875 [Myxococcales bacterium]|nr:MAG: hypothetical protein EOO75_09875 [Myxococcales bacterium]
MHLDGAGKTKSAFTYGGGISHSPVRVRHRSNGNYIVAGSVLSNGSTFGTGGTVIKTSFSFDAIFLAELTGAGANVKTLTFDQNPAHSAGLGTLGGVAVGADRVVVNGAVMQGPSPYHAGTDLGSGTATQGVFVASFDSDLTWRWDLAPSGFGVRSMAVTPAGAVVVAGSSNGVGVLTSYDSQGGVQPVTYYPHTDPTVVAAAPGGSVVFAARYEPGASLGSGPLTSSGWAIVKTP